MAKAEINIKVLDMPELTAYAAEVAAVVERMQGVVDAAQAWYRVWHDVEPTYLDGAELALIEAVDAYQAGAGHVWLEDA